MNIEDLTPEEQAEAFVFPNNLTPEEKAESDKLFSEYLFKLRKNRTWKQKVRGRLLQLRFILEDFFKR